MIPTLTDEDGRTAQYTLTPNYAGMTMTINTEEAKAFDAEALVKAAIKSTIDAYHTMRLPHIVEIGSLIKAAYEAGKRDAVPKWQPIETAPKDGTEIIATLIVRSIKGGGESFYWDTHVIAFDEESGDLVEYFGWDWDDYTHWMPLPPAPTIQSQPIDLEGSRAVQATAAVIASVLSASPKAGE